MARFIKQAGSTAETRRAEIEVRVREMIAGRASDTAQYTCLVRALDAA